MATENAEAAANQTSEAEDVLNATCQHCGLPMEPGSVGRRRKYCGPTCKSKARAAREQVSVATLSDERNTGDDASYLPIYTVYRLQRMRSEQFEQAANEILNDEAECRPYKGGRIY